MVVRSGQLGGAGGCEERAVVGSEETSGRLFGRQ